MASAKMPAKLQSVAKNVPADACDYNTGFCNPKYHSAVWGEDAKGATTFRAWNAGEVKDASVPGGWRYPDVTSDDLMVVLEWALDCFMDQPTRDIYIQVPTVRHSQATCPAGTKFPVTIYAASENVLVFKVGKSGKLWSSWGIPKHMQAQDPQVEADLRWFMDEIRAIAKTL